MGVIRGMMEAIAEATSTVVVGIGLILFLVGVIEPAVFTSPHIVLPQKPSQVIINPVKEMQGCHKRVKDHLMSAGEIKEEDINPKAIIMLCPNPNYGNQTN